MKPQTLTSPIPRIPRYVSSNPATKNGPVQPTSLSAKRRKPAARLELRAGVWLADGVPCPSWQSALQRTLEAADIGPQSGNSEHGSARVFRQRTAFAKAAGA